MQSQSTSTPNDQRRRTIRWRHSLISVLVVIPAVLVLGACGGAAPTPPSQPTVQAAATQVVAAASPAAATVQAAASPVAATAQAAASPVAATAQAAASPAVATAAALTGTAVTSVASPSPSPAAQGQGQLRIADASLSDATPWLSLRNDGGTPVDVGGWRLEVGTVSTELPGRAVVPPSGTLTLHAGTGPSSEDELYLGNAGDALAAAAQPGTRVRLTDETGRVVTEATVPRF